MECNGMFPKDGQIQSYHPKILNSKVIMIAQMNFQQCTLGYSLLCKMCQTSSRNCNQRRQTPDKLLQSGTRVRPALVEFKNS